VATVLSDTFTGSDGAAWDGTRWPNFYDSLGTGTHDIQGNQGRLLTGAGSYAVMQAELQDLSLVNFEATYDVEVQATTESYFQVEFRSSLTGDGNIYELVLRRDTGYLGIEKKVSYTPTVLDSTTLTITTSDVIHFRLRVVGSDYKARAWINGASEPGTWDLEATDGTYLTNDRVAFKAIAGAAATAQRWDIDNLTIDDTLEPPLPPRLPTRATRSLLIR